MSITHYQINLVIALSQQSLANSNVTRIWTYKIRSGARYGVIRVAPHDRSRRPTFSADTFGGQNNVKMAADIVAVLTTCNDAKALLDCGK